MSANCYIVVLGRIISDGIADGEARGASVFRLEVFPETRVQRLRCFVETMLWYRSLPVGPGFRENSENGKDWAGMVLWLATGVPGRLPLRGPSRIFPGSTTGQE